MARVSDERKYCSVKCYRIARYGRFIDLCKRGMRACYRCGIEKPHAEFYTQGDKWSGWCKECRKANERDRRADAMLVERFHVKYETDMRFRARELLRAIGKRARAERVGFDLDLEWLVPRLERGQCELTGLLFNYSVASRRRNAFTPSIDRIQAGGGYTKDNCRVILYALNSALGDWGIEAFLPIAEALVARLRKAGAA